MTSLSVLHCQSHSPIHTPFTHSYPPTAGADLMSCSRTLQHMLSWVHTPDLPMGFRWATAALSYLKCIAQRSRHPILKCRLSFYVLKALEVLQNVKMTWFCWNKSDLTRGWEGQWSMLTLHLLKTRLLNVFAATFVGIVDCPCTFVAGNAEGLMLWAWKMILYLFEEIYYGYLGLEISLNDIYIWPSLVTLAKKQRKSVMRYFDCEEIKVIQ